MLTLLGPGRFGLTVSSWQRYMGGCQNYGFFCIPIIIRYLRFRVPKKGTIILTTTHIAKGLGFRVYGSESRRDPKTVNLKARFMAQSFVL